MQNEYSNPSPLLKANRAKKKPPHDRTEVGCVQISTFMDAAVNRTCRENAHAVDGVSTGFPTLDDLVSGLRSGSLNVIAGRPAMGTTALAMNIVANVALIQNKQVVIFSLRHTGADLADRFLFSIGRIDRFKFRRGSLAERDQEVLHRLRKQFETAPIYIHDSAFNVAKISCQCRRLKKQLGSIGLIVIDPLQMLLEVESEDPHAEEIIRGLKLLAEDTGAAVLVTSSLSRRLEKRKSKWPCMRDLPQYSVLAEHADLVMALYREEYYKPSKHRKNDAELKILRDRHGVGLYVSLKFYPDYGLFEDAISGMVKNRQRHTALPGSGLVIPFPISTVNSRGV